MSFSNNYGSYYPQCPLVIIMDHIIPNCPLVIIMDHIIPNVLVAVRGDNPDALLPEGGLGQSSF